MDAEKILTTTSPRDNRLKKGAIACIVLLAFSIIAQLFRVWQTWYELESPLVPKSLIQEINKQFIFKAIVAAVVSLIVLALYYFKRHLLVIIFVILTLIASRYIYI